MWASSIARSGLWSPCPSALDAILETTIPFIQPELSLFSTTSSTHPHTVLWSWGVCPLFVKPSFKKAFVPRWSSAFVWEGFHMVSKYNWKQKYRYSVGAAQDKWTLTICSAILEHPLADYFKFELSEASIYISTSKWRGLKMDASDGKHGHYWRPRLFWTLLCSFSPESSGTSVSTVWRPAGIHLEWTARDSRVSGS